MFNYATAAAADLTGGEKSTSLGGRLIRLVIAGQERRADRRILMYLPRHETYRQEFGLELERRLLGQ